MTVPEMEERMRHLPVPVIPRTANDTIYLDVRTIESRWFETLADMLENLEGKTS